LFASEFAFLAIDPSSNSAYGVKHSKEETTMSRRRVNAVLPILIALVLAMPLAARDNGNKDSKTTRATMDIFNQTSLGGKEIKPGTYTVIVDGDKLTMQQGGKVVAEAPIQWKDETTKSRNSNIVTVGDHVTEIHFGGKMRYVEVSD
jgi:uncharacterized protein (UPF0333 family)